ncbi:MAG: TadE/TadG family type IV pilus assembly protein [Limisphaerales bacterium]
MNSHHPNGQTPGRRRRFWAARGQSYVELAVVLSVLAIVLVVAADFGRLFYTYVEVINAARAGAQYGSSSVITAADATGMSKAAKQDGVNIANLNVTASQCTCGTATATIPACASSFCIDDPQGNYVIVNTSVPFATIVKYPGVPSSIPLKSQAVMQVQQQ